MTMFKCAATGLLSASLCLFLLPTTSYAVSNGDFSSLSSRATGDLHYATSSGKGVMPLWMLLTSTGGMIETNGVAAAVGNSAFRFHTLTANFGDNKLDQCIPLDETKDLSISFQARTNVSPISNDLRIRVNPNFYADMASCEKDLQTDSTTNRLTTGSFANVDRDIRLGSVGGFQANQWQTITSATHGTTGSMTQTASNLPSGTQAMRFSIRVRDDSASSSRYIWLDDIKVTQPGSSANLIRNSDFSHIDVSDNAFLVSSNGWQLDRDGDSSLRAGAGSLAFALSGNNAFYFQSLSGNFGSNKLEQCIAVTGLDDLRPSLSVMSHSPDDDLNVRLNVDFYSSNNCGSGEDTNLQLREDFSINNLPGEWRRLVGTEERTAVELNGIHSAKISVRARDRSNSTNDGPDGFQRTLYIDDVNIDANIACDAPAVVDMYEVKFSLDPDEVLTSSHNLKNALKTEFDTSSTVRKFNVQFLETNSLDLNDEGWSIRTRKREDQSTHRLQFKKRYAVGSSTFASILQTGYTEGLNACSGLEVEVDWGYNNRTLSHQLNLDLSLPGYSGLALPTLSDTRDIATNNAMDQLINWSATAWGQTQIDDARLYGAIYFERYEGDFDGLELKIEIWHLIDEHGTGEDYLVEASFKTSNAVTASTKRLELMQLLDNEGWLLPVDALKTQVVLSRY
jgi:hypothetical protein